MLDKIYYNLCFLITSIFILFAREGAYISIGGIYITEIFIAISFIMLFIKTINRNIVMPKYKTIFIMIVIFIINILIAIYNTSNILLIYRNSATLVYMFVFIFISYNFYNKYEFEKLLIRIEKVIDITLLLGILNLIGIYNYAPQGEALSQYMFLGLLIKFVNKKSILMIGAYSLFLLAISIRSAYIGIVIVIVYMIVDIIISKKITIKKINIANLYIVAGIMGFTFVFIVNEAFRDDILGMFIDTGTGSYGNFVTRTIFWKQIFTEVLSSLNTTLIGLNPSHLFRPEFAIINNMNHIDPHNSYLTIMYRLGLIGIISFVIFILSVLFRFKRYCINNNLDEVESRYNIIQFYFILFILGHMIFSNILEGPYKCMIVWFFIGHMMKQIYIKKGKVRLWNH